jgi:hypothetical protein
LPADRPLILNLPSDLHLWHRTAMVCKKIIPLCRFFIFVHLLFNNALA